MTTELWGARHSCAVEGRLRGHVARSYDTKSSRELCPSAFGLFYRPERIVFSKFQSILRGYYAPLPAPNATSFHAVIVNRPYAIPEALREPKMLGEN